MYSPIPICLAFEPINLCNAQCFCCPYTEFAMDKTFTKQKMSVEQITQLMDDWGNLLRKHNIKPWSVSVLPWRYSDPLLNPHLDTVLQLADKHKTKVSLTTNAISFGKRQCDLLQKYSHTLTKIFISVVIVSRILLFVKPCARAPDCLGVLARPPREARRSRSRAPA